MEVRSGNGVEVASGGRTLLLDPKRAVEGQGAIVTHGHSDHLTADAHMTAPTLAFLRVRKPTNARGTPLAYGEEAVVGGFGVRLHDAGHIFGSAMVEVATDEGALLYTGDFNPRQGLTVGAAAPRACDTLVMESTYGDPRFDLPPKDLVLANLEAWTLQRLLRGPVALGAYPLGRAQELVFLANRAGLVPIVTPEIAELTAVYNAHGHDLRYAVAGSARALDLAESSALHIVGREALKRGSDFARGLRQRGGSAAYLSGWCHRYSYFGGYDIDAQFALSDHASFSDLVAFALACGPKRVFTMHGAAASLARELRSRGLSAEAL